MNRPSPVELVMRAFHCPCGAVPGERCLTRNGSNRSESHAERYQAAVAAGRLPLPDDAAGQPVDATRPRPTPRNPA